MKTASRVPKTVATRRVYEGEYISLRLDTLQLGNAPAAERAIVEHPGAVVIVPVTAAGSVLLVRQWRQPAGEVLLEAPAGTLEPGESPQETARRELQEETGYAAERLESIGQFYTAPGFCTELMHAYLATGLTPSSLPQDPDEDVRVEEAPLARVTGLIESGQIRDAKTIASLLTVLALHSAKLPGGS